MTCTVPETWSASTADRSSGWNPNPTPATSRRTTSRWWSSTGPTCRGFSVRCRPTARKLRPWFCLVVVEQQEGVELSASGEKPLPTLTIGGPADPARELPDPTNSWAWAHAQVVGAGSSGATRCATNSKPTPPRPSPDWSRRGDSNRGSPTTPASYRRSNPANSRVSARNRTRSRAATPGR
ncbi:hypothetical protein [Halorussus caseinilyticus]|uniref:Uncharacterized protein n=1 Tax=Halorussus caseinilyticus TaxID=3034025 RepID=A0ABD5WPX9_9EURY